MVKRITLKQVAAQAGVSYQTVSKVLNGKASVSPETEQRIREAARQLDYRPNRIARGLRAHRSYLIGYSWAPAPPGGINPILENFLQGMIQAAAVGDYHLLFFPYRPGKQWVDEYRNLIDTNRVDGFILSSVEYDDPRLIFLEARKFPFVAFGRSNPGWDFPFVDLDGGEGMRAVARHLLGNCHRRIAIVAWPENSRVGQNRMEGLREVLGASGVMPGDQWLLRGEGSYEFGYQSARQLLSAPPGNRPTAIVAFNDLMAVGAVDAGRSLGLSAGKDYAVTGYDDTPFTQYLNPSLTTVRQPVVEIGRCAIEMLLAILDERGLAERQVLITPQLVVRQSSDFQIENHPIG